MVASTPWQPEFCNWAFNLPRGEKLLAKWRLIPSDTDVLVTHTPPYGRGDRVGHMRVGCEELAREVSERIQPQFHVFGHVHEGYGKSSDGTTIYMNASSCTHDYEAINAPFVFDLNVSKSGGIGASAPHLNGASIASMVAAANSSVGCSNSADGRAATLDYARMLHEQLRVCSQKAPFVPKPRASVEGETAADGPRRLSLREFRVDGTTSGLLLESTLKLRPVVGEQTRALRYLFHNGVNGRVGTAAAAKTSLNGNGGASTDASGEATATHSTEDAGELIVANASTQQPARASHRRPVLRRVTMAVLDHVSESKELTNAEIHELESSASTLAKASDAVVDEGDGAVKKSLAPSTRVRRNKTLQRREGLVRLAPMPEEPDEKQTQQQQEAPLSVPETEAHAAAAEQSVSTVAAVVEVAAAPPAAPVVVVECTLCKYKVPGHVHPGSTLVVASTAPLPPPAAAAAVVIVECTLCKYKVPGHVHPGSAPVAAGMTSTPATGSATVISRGVTTVQSSSSVVATTASSDRQQEEAPANESARQKSVGSSRLSSWF